MSGHILITGGAGFIGASLARELLTCGYTVHLVDNYARAVKDPDLDSLLIEHEAEFDELNLLNPDVTQKLGTGFDAIFHLAAIVGVSHVIKRPYQVLVNNIRMLENVISLAKRQKNLSRLLFSSTSEVYAGTLKHFDLKVPSPETSALALTDLTESRTVYMLSKIVGEAMCHHSGVPYTIFRPHNVYGPRMGMSHVIPEQLRNIWEAASPGSIEVNSLDHRRAFCYIEDAVQMLKRMLEKEVCIGKTLNLGTQLPEVSIREVVQTCIDVTGKEILIKALPETPGSPHRRAPDMHLTKKCLKFESQVSLKAGISQTWKWYRDNVFENQLSTAI